MNLDNGSTSFHVHSLHEAYAAGYLSQLLRQAYSPLIKVRAAQEAAADQANPSATESDAESSDTLPGRGQKNLPPEVRRALLALAQNNGWLKHQLEVEDAFEVHVLPDAHKSGQFNVALVAVHSGEVILAVPMDAVVKAAQASEQYLAVLADDLG